jgi:hypothetical protein
MLGWDRVGLSPLGCGFPRPADVDDDAGPVGAGSADAAPGSDAAVVNVVPTLTAISPDWGSMAGGTRVTVTGSGFTGGHLVVSFGTSAGSQVTVVSDAALTVTTPPGLHMPVTVSVATDGGVASTGIRFRYLAPLYAADGRGVTPGNLYRVDPSTAATTFVGSLGVAMTGLAISPAGVLFGATTAKGGGTLVTIDPYTARPTSIGALVTPANAEAHTPDLAFEGTTLLGWHNGGLSIINTSSGQVTSFAGTSTGGGMGLVSAGPGVLFLARSLNLSTVNTATGVVTPGAALSGGKPINCLTFVGTTLFGGEATSTLPNTEALVTINPSSGAVTVIGTLPPNVDALAGIPAIGAQVAAVPAPSGVSSDDADEPRVRIDGRAWTWTDVRRMTGGGASSLVSLRSVAASGLGDRVVLVSTGGRALEVDGTAPGLALQANHRHEIKLVDARTRRRIFSPIVEIRRERTGRRAAVDRP